MPHQTRYDLFTQFINEGNINKVSELLNSENLNINEKDSEGNCLLIQATSKNQAAIVEMLLKKGAFIDTINKEGKTALHIAASKGYIETLKVLIENNANLNIKGGYFKNTPLTASALCNRLVVAKMLLKAGARVEEIDKDSKTALQIAVDEKNEAMVKLLLDYNPNIYIRDKFGDSLLMSSVKRRYSNFKIVQMLIDKGLDVNEKNPKGDPPLFLAINARNESMIKLLLNNNANIDAVNSKGDNAFIVASRLNEYYIIKTLEEFGVKNPCNEFEETLKNAKENLIVKPLVLEEGIKYSPINIIKSVSLCQNPEKNKPLANDFFNDLENYCNSDLRVSLIFTYASLAATENNGLEFRIADGEDIFPLSLFPQENGADGCYDSKLNTVIFSNINKPLKSSQIITHETMHKLYRVFPELDKKLLEESYLKTCENIKNIPDCTGKNFVKKDVLERLCLYPTNESKIEEAFADVGKLLIYSIQNPKEKQDIIDSYKYLVEYFDLNVVPKLEKAILSHPNLNKISLPENVKQRLKELKVVEKNKEVSLKETISYFKENISKKSKVNEPSLVI